MQRYVQLARDWHGGDAQPVDELQIDDPDLPAALIACGELVSLTFGLSSGGHRKLTLDEDSEAYLAFDPEDPDGRLYLLLPDDAQDDALNALWTGRGLAPIAELAEQLGGRHQGDYPDIDVQPLGPIIQVEYGARKYGEFGADDGAIFHHEHEPAHPWLAIDAEGRLWIVGGDYVGSDLRGIVG